MGEEEGVIVRHSFKREAVNGELKISGGEAKGFPGVVGNGECLVESGSGGVKERCVRGGGNRGVDNGQGNRPLAVNEGLESDGELGVSLSQNGGSDVGQTDTDEGFVGVVGMRATGSIEPSGSA